MINCTLERNEGHINVIDAFEIGNTIINNVSAQQFNISTGAFTNLGNNCIPNITGVEAIFGPATNDVIANPLLLPLADNGGETWTCLIQSDSPCRSAGSVLIVNSLDDQIGNPRVVNNLVDIGSVQLQAVICLTGDMLVETSDGWKRMDHVESFDQIVSKVFGSSEASIIRPVHKIHVSHNVQDAYVIDDLVITPGHYILYSDLMIKAKHYPDVQKIFFDPCNVFNLELVGDLKQQLLFHVKAPTSDRSFWVLHYRVKKKK